MLVRGRESLLKLGTYNYSVPKGKSEEISDSTNMKENEHTDSCKGGLNSDIPELDKYSIFMTTQISPDEYLRSLTKDELNKLVESAKFCDVEKPEWKNEDDNGDKNWRLVKDAYWDEGILNLYVVNGKTYFRQSIVRGVNSDIITR